ncbi:MAG: glycosyl hydrolase family 18 protein [Candidatus Andersenbacteria bacterium]
MLQRWLWPRVRLHSALLGGAGVVVVVAVATIPRAVNHDAAPTPAPYFSTGQSFLGHGTGENLDTLPAASAPAATTLTAPASTWTVAGANSVTVSWTRQPLAARYEVSYRNEASGRVTTATTDVPLYAIKDALPGTTYSVTVTSLGKDGQRSDPSARSAVTPSQVETSQTTTRQPFEVATWMPSDFNVADARASFERGTGTATEVNPFWFDYAATGELQAKGGARNPELVARAHQAGQRVLPTVTNNFDGDRVATLLADVTKQDALRKAILDEVAQGGFDGFDLDFENIHAGDRDAYSGFVSALANDLHGAGKLLEVTVQPKKSDGDTWDGAGSIDAATLGAAADRIKVMTYDFSRTNTQPGPIAPLPWLTEVMTYWTSKVPAAKLLAGLPFYGYDWSLDSDDDHGVTWESVERVRGKYQVTESLDTASGEPYLTYSDEHGPRVVYYQDAASVGRKISAIKATGVAGVAIWLLGQEDPADFGAIRSQITTTTRTVERPLRRWHQGRGRRAALADPFIGRGAG